MYICIYVYMNICVHTHTHMHYMYRRSSRSSPTLDRDHPLPSPVRATAPERPGLLAPQRDTHLPAPLHYYPLHCPPQSRCEKVPRQRFSKIRALVHLLYKSLFTLTLENIQTHLAPLHRQRQQEARRALGARLTTTAQRFAIAKTCIICRVGIV
jgi:hypothetical protein